VARFIDLQDSVYAANTSLQKRAVVEIPQEEVTVKKSKKRGRDKAKWVTVRRGDTLSNIARRNGTSVNNIRRLNGIRGNSIRAGKKLRVR
jgi:membrane-bound lytic murein transglycosylase D